MDTSYKSDAFYENPALVRSIVAVLEEILNEGEKVIWREPFRWKDRNGVLSNCYEMFSATTVCETAGLKLIHDLNHFAIVREK